MRNLAARAAMMGGSEGGEVYDVQDYVGWGTSDLVYMWDGIRNVSSTSEHSSSITSWTDIVSGKEMSLSAFEITSNSIYFNGTYLSYGQVSSFNVPATCTIEIGVSNFGLVRFGNLVHIAYSLENNGVLLSSNNAHFEILWDNSWTKGYTGSSLNRESGASYFFSLIGDGENKQICDRGILKGTSSRNVCSSFTNTMRLNSHMQCSSSRNLSSSGNYHFVRVYNKALTEAERLVNYAVDCARFGIT